MPDEPHEMPRRPRVGTWRTPDGNMLEATALQQMMDVHVSINVLFDGRIMDIHEALGFAVAQRDWYREKLADARAQLQRYEGHP